MTVLCLFLQDLLTYCVKAGKDTKELEVRVLMETFMIWRYFVNVSVQDNNSYSCLAHRKRWRWCAWCQNVAMTWWMWADYKALRFVFTAAFSLHTVQEKQHFSSFFLFLFMFVYQGNITAQGKLLQQETFTVTEQDSGFLSRAKERRVFLFEQLVIFSEPIDKKKDFSIPGYIFKNSIKVCAFPSSMKSCRM